MKKIIFGLALFASGFIIACNPDNGTPDSIEGWKPVYKQDAVANPIESQAARNTEVAGKIFVKGTKLYQVEVNKGIHVLDISNPQSPQKIGFIAIDGAQELTIRDHYLYSNNYNDLVVVDIADLANVSLTKRVPNTFTFASLIVPPQQGFFECIDPDKGIVVGWEFTTIHKPKCKL